MFFAISKILAKFRKKTVIDKALAEKKEPIQPVEEKKEPIQVKEEKKEPVQVDEEKRKKYIKSCYDPETHEYPLGYKIKFMNGFAHGNYVDVNISLDYQKVSLDCYTPGSGIGYGTGYMDAGGCSYVFPAMESLEYLNLIAFIREQTWIGDNFNKILTREEFEQQLADIGYTEE